uniref:Si:ch211-257p13.3 n=1 Tax=Sinocyclocheilus anshuiensis TaxID=1608454 RepID=A0A671LQ49_9TELE
IQCMSEHLAPQIAAYEREIGTLREELLKEIGHLEEKKEAAVKAAANCSQEHLQSLALPPTLRTMKTDYASLRSQVRNFSDFYGTAIKEIMAAINEMSEANKDLLEKYRKEVALRRKYHEQLVELKGNIRVLCRVKPVLKEDQHEEGQAVVVTTDPNNESALTVLSKGKAKNFELDKVFHPQATQEEVFQEIEPLITSCIDGYHVCIFAYGQTGSGKTYSMEGTVENPGINQRALKHLFNEIEERKDMWTYTVSVSSVEIYNEVLRDLLSKDGEKLDIKINPDGTGQLHVPGLRVMEVKSFQHIKKVKYQPLTAGSRRCDPGLEGPPDSHTLQELTTHLPAAGLTGKRQQNRHGCSGTMIYQDSLANPVSLAVPSPFQNDKCEKLAGV